MNISIIGYSDRVKKFYLKNKRLNILKIIRKREVNENIYTKNLNDLLESEIILISLSSKKTSFYLRELIKLKFKGQIIIETPSVSILNYYTYFFNKNIIVLEELIFDDLILKIRRILKKEKIINLFVINKGYMVFYHFLSIIFFWNDKKMPRLVKITRGFFYFRSKKILIKTDLKKNEERKLLVKIVTNKNSYKFDIKKFNSKKLRSINVYLKILQISNKKILSIKDYNSINQNVLIFKILDYVIKLFRI